MNGPSVPKAAEHSAGRDDYAQLAHFRQLAPGEPYFLIRGQDRVSGDAVRAWASLARLAGAPPALVEQALRQADNLDRWPAKKLPDADHIDPAEQQQLAYALERRAWNAREDCADMKVMLAEERAITAARSQLRPVLTELFERGRWQENGAFVFLPREDEPAEGDEPDAASKRTLRTNAILALQRLDLILRGFIGAPSPQGKAMALRLGEAAQMALDEAHAASDRGDEPSRQLWSGRAEAYLAAVEMALEP